MHRWADNYTHAVLLGLARGLMFAHLHGFRFYNITEENVPLAGITMLSKLLHLLPQGLRLLQLFSKFLYLDMVKAQQGQSGPRALEGC